MAEVARLTSGADSGATARGYLTMFTVPNMHCGGCMRAVERALDALPDVVSARANLSQRRVTLMTTNKPASAEAYLSALSNAGFPAQVLTDASPESPAEGADGQLLKCLGVAGFAAANVMLLSVAVWSGHGGDMPASLQTAFHWLSAAIALPAVAFAGRPFFTSARAALGAGRLNMDVPISLGVILATAMSLYQTVRGSEQVYFDAAITLLFFLLIGRVLDQRMRARAAGAAANLLALRSPVTSVIDADGRIARVATTDVRLGMRVLVAAGERVPVDGRILVGRAMIDESLITGESVPRSLAPGDVVLCGTINMSAPIELEATAAADNTLLADIARMMNAAEQARGRYVRLADRAAQLYAPAVHALGAATLLGWLALGHGWEPALTAAIAVLIITCPCALALAVPAVQVVATSRLFRRGIIVKSGDALERLSEIDTIILDKTGTLTVGEPRISGPVDDDVLAAAAAVAACSRHPYARAITIAAAERKLAVPVARDVTEDAGAGMRGTVNDHDVRVGSAGFCGIEPLLDGPGVHVRRGSSVAAIAMRDTLRADAKDVVATLKAAGFRLEVLSGDRQQAVSETAHEAGVCCALAEATPAAKLRRLDELVTLNRRVLMVGDGLNDAPALAAGHASMSPSSAADISQSAADVVFQGQHLAPIIETIAVARMSQRRARQNFAIALGYNALFVPLAVAGYVTPLVAAIAMSASSLAVTANALRLAHETLELKP